MRNIKIIKTSLSIIILFLSVCSLILDDSSYQNITLLFVSALLGVIGIEETRKGESKRWSILSFVAAIIVGLVLVHSIILFLSS